MKTLHFNQLTSFQKNFIMTNLEKFWEVFVAGDADLVGSSCDCCTDKRELLASVANIIEAAPPSGDCSFNCEADGPSDDCPKHRGMSWSNKAGLLPAMLPPTCEKCGQLHASAECPPCGNCHHPGHGGKWCEEKATVTFQGQTFQSAQRCLCYPGYGKKA